MNETIRSCYILADDGEIQSAIALLKDLPDEIKFSDRSLIALADMHHRAGDFEASFQVLSDALEDPQNRSDYFIEKYCDYARDIGKGYLGEDVLKQLVSAGRKALNNRLADHFREGRNWDALRKLINGIPSKDLSPYLIYLLGRANASLLIESSVIACVDMLWALPSPGPRYAQILADVWRWRVGDVETSRPITSVEDLPDLIQQDALAIESARSSALANEVVMTSVVGWRSIRPRANLPNVLAIGTQRSATTWLWYQFTQCSEVQQLPFKESVYFSDAFDSPFTVDPSLKDFISDEDVTYWEGPTRNIFRYLRLFNGGKKIRADFSPSYVELPPETVEVIADVLGRDARIIFCMRDPIERSWSNLLYDCKLGGVDVKLLSRPERFAHYRSDISQRRSDYHVIYKAWSGHFKSIMPVFHEEILSRPDLTLAKILKFAGAKVSSEDWMHGGSLAEKVNLSLSDEMPSEDRLYLYGLHQSRLIESESLFGERARVWRLRQESILNS